MSNPTQSVPLQNIGRYEITGELGHGAMGIVYKAIDPNIGRTVALKTMRMDINAFDHDELLRRFKNEARAAGALNHPNIVTIYDADEASGLFYIAMEFLEGRTLESVLAENRMLPVERVIELMRQIVSGLDYAHGMSVVHRDIKPANILLTRQGIVKIMDFGIAKAGAAMATSASSVLGTPNYMSPEQVRGRAIDGRSDLFSLGVVLYQMITGERPFAGENVTTVIYKIVNEQPVPPRDLDVSIHPGLSLVATKALAKDSNERYQTGAAMLRDLENYKSLASDESITIAIATEDADSDIDADKADKNGKSDRGKDREVTPATANAGATPINRAAAQIGAGIALPGNNRFIGNPPLPPRTPTPSPKPIAPAATATSTTMPLRLKEDINKPKIQETVYKRRRISPRTLAILIIAVLLIAAGVGFSTMPPAKRIQLESMTQGWFQGLLGMFFHPSDQPPAKTTPAPTPSGSTTITTKPLRSQSVAPATKAEPVASEASGSDTDDETDGGHTSRPRDAMAAKTGDVLVNSKPVNGVSIQIDGRTDPGWHTPFLVKGLNPGSHEFVFSLAGYSTETRSVDVKAGNNSYTVEMASSGATLVVTSNPKGASIELDGSNTGQLTPHTFPVTPGPHIVTLTMRDFEAVPLTTNVQAGKTTTVNGLMPPVNTPDHDGIGHKMKNFFGGATSIPAGKGLLHLTTNPSGATVIINGKTAGSKTPSHGLLPTGDYQVSLHLSGYKDEARTIHLDEGQENDVSIDLRKK